MKKIISAATILLLHVEFSYADPADISLCKANEETIFSCQTAKKKIISLCEFRTRSSNFIEYRYGTLANVELSYRADAKSKNKFYQGTFHGGKISTNLIWFNNGPFTYSIFSPDWGQDGVAVINNDKLISSQKCSEKSSADIGETNLLIESRSEDEAEKIISKILR